MTLERQSLRDVDRAGMHARVQDERCFQVVMCSSVLGCIFLGCAWRAAEAKDKREKEEATAAGYMVASTMVEMQPSASAE